MDARPGKRHRRSCGQPWIAATPRSVRSPGQPRECGRFEVPKNTRRVAELDPGSTQVRTFCEITPRYPRHKLEAVGRLRDSARRGRDGGLLPYTVTLCFLGLQSTLSKLDVARYLSQRLEKCRVQRNLFAVTGFFVDNRDLPFLPDASRRTAAQSDPSIEADPGRDLPEVTSRVKQGQTRMRPLPETSCHEMMFWGRMHCRGKYLTSLEPVRGVEPPTR